MNHIIGVVGPSGSGKTTIIVKAVKALPDKVKIIKSAVTRGPRPGDVPDFYDFVTMVEFNRRRDAGKFYNVVEYAGNMYAADQDNINEILKTRHGIFAVVEQSIKEFQDKGLPIKIVRINPKNQNVIRGSDRLAADFIRQRVPIKVDLEITNSFEPGGLNKAVQDLVGFIKSLN